MIVGQGSLSYRRADIGNEKNASMGFQKTYFAHKATAGDTGINLNALTIPTEMSSNGFANPTTAVLQGANLLFFKNNLRLESSVRGLLMQGLSYVISSSSQISFLGFTAAQSEIFTGTIDYNPTSGVKVVDARAITATGTLAAAATDFNVGTPFTINQNPGSQLGGVLVFVDGVLQARNSGNSSAVQDANYYELPIANSSLCSTIRFNVAHPTAARNIVVVSNGLLVERPDGSMMATIEAINGSVQNMATYVAAATGQTATTVLGATPSNVDLKAFSDRVVALETRANVDESPTLQTDVIATRLGQKSYFSGTNYNGGNTPSISGPAGLGSLYGEFLPYQTQGGLWRLRFQVTFSMTATTTMDFTISGVAFHLTAVQAIATCTSAGVSVNGRTDTGTGACIVRAASAATSCLASGDVALSSKPTWAY